MPWSCWNSIENLLQSFSSSSSSPFLPKTVFIVRVYPCRANNSNLGLTNTISPRIIFTFLPKTVWKPISKLFFFVSIDFGVPKVGAREWSDNGVKSLRNQSSTVNVLDLFSTAAVHVETKKSGTSRTQNEKKSSVGESHQCLKLDWFYFADPTFSDEYPRSALKWFLADCPGVFIRLLQPLRSSRSGRMRPDARPRCSLRHWSPIRLRKNANTQWRSDANVRWRSQHRWWVGFSKGSETCKKKRVRWNESL